MRRRTSRRGRGESIEVCSVGRETGADLLRVFARRYLLHDFNGVVKSGEMMLVVVSPSSSLPLASSA